MSKPMLGDCDLIMLILCCSNSPNACLSNSINSSRAGTVPKYEHPENASELLFALSTGWRTLFIYQSM